MPWDRELLEAALIGFERSESGSAGAHRRGSEQDRRPRSSESSHRCGGTAAERHPE